MWLWLELVWEAKALSQTTLPRVNVFNRGVNMSAQWDDVDKFRPGHTHGRSFDDSQTTDIELAHYYAVDQCDAPYIAIFQTDMPLGSREGLPACVAV